MNPYCYKTGICWKFDEDQVIYIVPKYILPPNIYQLQKEKSNLQWKSLA